MKNCFQPMRRRGEHWKLVGQTVECLRTMRFDAKVRTEHAAEVGMVRDLERVADIAPHLATQLRDHKIDKGLHATVLGKRHRPDVAIGVDGTAIELKYVKDARHLREAIGQAIMYRTRYRFVVMCLVDRTSRKELVTLASDPMRPGHHLFHGLTEMGIFTVICPRPAKRARDGFDNVVFLK